jgi:hypothetical protein
MKQPDNNTGENNDACFSGCMNNEPGFWNFKRKLLELRKEFAIGMHCQKIGNSQESPLGLALAKPRDTTFL